MCRLSLCSDKTDFEVQNMSSAEIFESSASQQAIPVTGDQSSSLAGDLWKGMQRGAGDELNYDREHYLNTSLRAGGSALVTHFGTVEDDLLKSNKKLALVVGAGFSVGHFILSPGHLDEVNSKAKESHSVAEGIGYGAGRFFTDAALTMGLTSAVSKATWTVKGNSAIETILNSETRSFHQEAFRSARGHWAPGKTISEPFFRQERAEAIGKFLSNRGQPERFEGLARRLQQLPESKNQTVWTYDNPINGGPRFFSRFAEPPKLDLTKLMLESN